MNERVLDLSDFQHFEHSPVMLPRLPTPVMDNLSWGQINAGAMRCHILSTSFIYQSYLPEGQCALNEKYFTEN